MRGGDEHTIDLGIGQQIVEGVGLPASELAGERRPPRLAPGVATGDGDVGDLPHSLGQHLPPPAESDASESHLLHAAAPDWGPIVDPIR
jgi:hypothetical protein